MTARRSRSSLSARRAALRFEELCATKASLSELERFYGSLYVAQFPDPDERESLANMKRYLRLKEGRFYGRSNYHIVLAKRENEIVGGSIFDYLAAPNAGVIEFLFAAASARRSGVGKALLDATLRVLSRDARTRLKRPLRAVVAEMNDPFVEPTTADNMDPFERALIWGKWGFSKLEFSYVQPALSRGQAPVSGLLLIVKPRLARERRAVERDFVLLTVAEYMRLAMRIRAPRQNPEYRAMRARLRHTPEVRVRALDEYVGAKDARYSVRAIAEPNAGFRATYAAIRAAISVKSRVAPRSTFEEALAYRGREYAYHLWALMRPHRSGVAGAASFFTFPSCGFGGYIVLGRALRGRRLLRGLLARIEACMQRDRPSLRGWFIECGADSQSIFERAGFVTIPAPYRPPGLEAHGQGELALLYKEFGRDRSPLPRRRNLLRGCEDILRYVYHLERPRAHACYRSLARG